MFGYFLLKSFLEYPFLSTYGVFYTFIGYYTLQVKVKSLFSSNFGVIL